MNISSLTIVLCIAGYTSAYHFLLCFPVPGKSLNILGEGYVRHLLDAGHEITYITAFPMKNMEKKKLRQIDVGDNIKTLVTDITLNVEYLMSNPTRDSANYLQDLAIRVARATFSNKNVKKLLEDPKEKFDAVIVDLLETEVYAGLSALYDCPMIWAYSLGVQWSVLRLIDEPANPSYVPDYHSSSNLPPFTFLQRLEELWKQLRWDYIKRFISYPQEEAIYTEVFGPLLAKRGRHLPVYKDLIYNSSLVLASEHHAFGKIAKTPQNFKFIGGYHIETPTKPLPADLQTLLDNSKNGVIYFSLGSTWQSKDIPTKVKEDLLKMFGELKQTVIWKYEEDLPNVPSNLHIMKWTPQQSILAHPNTLFFISHGGHLSSTESIHFGVPVIGVPLYMDQFVNIHKAVSRGYAIKVALDFDMAKNLKSAIEQMLNDRSYRNKVKELSAIYHDRPIPAGKELVHWVEHVVRTRGAPHLRSPALHMPWYQKLYLDLIAIITALLITFFVAIKLLINKSKTSVKTNKKKKH